MLTNEIYIGNMVQGKYGSISYKTKQNKPRPKELWYRVEGTHEPIIDRPLWNKVQEMIAQRSKPFITGEVGIFARKIKCANCGYTMRTAKKGPHRYFKCSNYHVSKDSCTGSFISYERLEQSIIAELHRISEEYLNQDEVAQRIEFQNNLQEQKARVKNSIAEYKKKVSEYSTGIRELYLDKVRGLLGESDFVSMSKEFTNERDRLEGLIVELEKQADDIEEKLKTGDNRRAIVEQYMNITHLNREIVDTMIESVYVSRRIPGTRNVPIEIHWKF